MGHPGTTRDVEGTLLHLALWSKRNVGISLKLIKERCLKMQQDFIWQHTCHYTKGWPPMDHRASPSHSGPNKISVLWHLNSFEDLVVKGSFVTVSFGT